MLPSGVLTSYSPLWHQLAWAGRKHTSAIYLSRKKKSHQWLILHFSGLEGVRWGWPQHQPQTEESRRLCPSTHIYMHLCNSQETFHFNVWQDSVCFPHSYLESRSPDVRVTSPNLSPFSPSICQTLEEWNLNRRLENLFSWALS